MTLNDIIATAWRTERERYFITNKDAPIYGLVEKDRQTDLIVFEGRDSAVQAHLDSLCAAAVERALPDVEFVVRDEIGVIHELHGAPMDIWRYLLRAMIAQANSGTDDGQ